MILARITFRVNVVMTPSREGDCLTKKSVDVKVVHASTAWIIISEVTYGVMQWNERSIGTFDETMKDS